MVKKLFLAIFMKKIRNFDSVCKKINIPINEIKQIEKAIQVKNGKVFIVGGAVRDLIMKTKNENKVDLSVNINLNNLKYCLKRSKIRFLPLGIEYGSLLIVINKITIDITVMRTDIRTNGRWAEIKFTNNLNDDASRRDFSFNSIYCDVNGNILDPNNGIYDLKKGLVRFIGNIQTRVEEDFLRILRYFRFSLFYSKNIDRKTVEILKKNYLGLDKLSFERKFNEIAKILSYKDLHHRLEKVYTQNEFKNLLEKSFKVEFDFKNFKKFCKIECELNCVDFQRRIKYLLRNNKNTKKFLEKLDNDLKRRLLVKINNLKSNEKYLKRILYENERKYVEDKLIIQFVETNMDKKALLELRSFIKDYEKKKFPIRGEDLIKLGFEEGEMVGQVLKRTEYWWIESNFTKNKRSCLDFASKYLPGSVGR